MATQAHGQDTAELLFKEPISKIHGIKETTVASLNAVNIQTVSELLQRGQTLEQRHALEKVSGVAHDTISHLLHQVELMRIQGINSEFSDLLMAAGVASIKDLARRVGEHLFEMLMKANKGKCIVDDVPSVQQCESWIAEAKKMSPLFEHSQVASSTSSGQQCCL